MAYLWDEETTIDGEESLFDSIARNDTKTCALKFRECGRKVVCIRTRILRTGVGDSDDKERNENKYNRIHFKYSGRKVCVAILHSNKCIAIVMKSLQQK